LEEDEVRKKYIVQLKESERNQLKEVVSKGKTAAYKIKHANILLAADIKGRAWQDEAIAQAYSVSLSTIGRIRQRFAEKGWENALGRKPQEYPSNPPKFDGASEARLIALSCSQPPEGYSRWTLMLLADKVVELEIVDKVSYETIRQTLKKTNSSPICDNAGSSRPNKMRNL
jgi:transposase